MNFLDLFLIAVALSMDAFAVSICKGLSVPKVRPRHALTAGLYFGGFQFLMPVIGWLLGYRFEHIITSFDHWIAFALLSFIGTKMIIDWFKESERDISTAGLSFTTIIILSIATSIDALAVGVSFTCMAIHTLSDVLSPVIIIGITSFLLSVIGSIIGVSVGRKFRFPAELIGGTILIAIGIKVLIQHLC